MEDTLISSSVGQSDHERASDNQGIVASTSPSNEVAITTSVEDEASGYFKMAHDIFLEFKAAGNISSLNTAIYLLECAASSLPPGDTEFSDCLNHLATALLIRYTYTMQHANDVHKAFILRCGALGAPVQDFLQYMVGEHIHDVYSLEVKYVQVVDRHADATSKDTMNSALMIIKEFLQAHNPATLETAILLYQEGLKLTAETHSLQWGILWELSDALLIQFHHTGNLSQVYEAISCLEQVKKAKVNRSICLFAAIITAHQILELLSEPKVKALAEEVVKNEQKAQDLMELGQDFFKLFQMHHDLIHLEATVTKWRDAELLLSWGHESRGKLLNDLAVAVQTRYNQRGNPKDLDEAITLHRESLEIRAVPHPDRGMSLNNLATALQTRFQQWGDHRDIDEAIILHREALEIWASPHPSRVKSLNNLATAVQKRFEQHGDPKDIDESITLLREALQICAAPHPLRGNSLNNLANAVQSRFEQQGDLTDIDEAITLHREALEIHAAHHPDRGLSLNGLGFAVQKRFEKRGDSKDIDEAIILIREALEIHAAPHPLRSGSLNNLAGAVRMRFEQRGDPRDIDEAITLHREALELCAAPHPDRGKSLNNLADAVQTRFVHRGDPKDIDEAIALNKEALEICAAPHPDRAMYLMGLASAVHIRFEHRGDPKDIDDAITLHREALGIWVLPHPFRDSSLNNLATAVETRFEHQGDPKDIDEAIMLHREALQIRAAPHPLRGMSLNNLAVAVHRRFKKQGDPKDINEAITLNREALEIHAAPHPDHGMSLNSLASSVQTRFEQHGDPKDIDEAITLLREALQICAAPHPLRGSALTNLATAVQRQFDQQGDPKNIDEAIILLREALEIHAAPHPLQGMSLNNLARAIHRRFEQRGDPNDIDEAINLHREALELRAAPHPMRGMCLNNLATAVRTRFEQRGDPKDINEAIILLREALEICAAPHPDRGMCLNNLATAVQTRFRQWGDLKDINEAIILLREALEICASPHPDRGMCLNNLAIAILTQFRQQGDPKDIDEAIILHREAVEIQPAPHPVRGMSLNNLATAVQTRFEERGDPKDIDEAISLLRGSLETCAAPHPFRGNYLENLATALQTRFEERDDPNDIDEAITLLREASTYKYSSPLTRFSTSHKWIKSATKHVHQTLVDAYHTAINLLPQLAAFSLDLKSRQQMLARKDIVSLASASASCAIDLNRNDVAVEFLEASRSIFWAQALQLRTPVDKLENIKPELSIKLRHLSQQLEQASFRHISQNISMQTQHHLRLIEAVTTQCRKLNEEWDKTVNAVRKVPGFGDFLEPKRFASLCQAAASGPIIILLASDSACSALIVNSTGGVQHVRLPTLKVQTVEHYYADLPRALSDRTFNLNRFLEAHQHDEPSTQHSDLDARLYGGREGRVNMNPNDIFRRLLAEMWQAIVKPVFEVLNLKKSENPSRLWWCLTGPFSFVPIHAAGIYDTNGTDCVSDYVISSYTPTLAALLDPPAHMIASFKMTAVIEPHAPNCSALPGTKMELEKIERRVPGQWLTSLKSTTRDIVMDHLQSSSAVHFACHGTQDLENPLNSGLILSDGRLDVSRIMRAPVNDDTKHSLRLAFLSACETAKGDAETPDEAMHLAATLLFAGFGGVVATMWRMDDSDGPKIADTFYEYLFKDGSPDSLPDLSKAAEALHLAVTKLYREPGMTFQRWVPFVHYGL